MYEIVRPTAPASTDAQPSLVVTMRENRSRFSTDARTAIGALALALMMVGILPALKGLLFVPVAAMAGLAVLTFALERHARSVPAGETLEIAGDVVRHHDHGGRRTEVPLGRVRLRTTGRAESNLRLFVETHHARVEIGRCLGLAERRELAGLIDGALAEAQRGLRAVPLWAWQP
jgi:uncharacterized membrane protein